jgi:hypothetical protein
MNSSTSTTTTTTTATSKNNQSKYQCQLPEKALKLLGILEDESNIHGVGSTRKASSLLGMSVSNKDILQMQMQSLQKFRTSNVITFSEFKKLRIVAKKGDKDRLVARLIQRLSKTKKNHNKQRRRKSTSSLPAEYNSKNNSTDTSSTAADQKVQRRSVQDMSTLPPKPTSLPQMKVTKSAPAATSYSSFNTTQQQGNKERSSLTEEEMIALSELTTTTEGFSKERRDFLKQADTRGSDLTGILYNMSDHVDKQ